jgi:hypothetical protein
MIARRLSVRSRRGAYVALAALTAIWGSNWIAMKLALARADPIVFNIERTWVAIAVLFAVSFLTKLAAAYLGALVAGLSSQGHR